MKIAILNSFYYPDEPGGAERSVRSLSEGLAADGEEVVVICLGRQRETEKINGVRVERFSIRNFYLPDANSIEQPSARSKFFWHLFDSANYIAAADIRRFLASYMPHVLHTNNLSGFSTAVWSAAKSLSIPIVHTTRDFYLLCPRATMRKGDRACAGQCRACAILSSPRLAMSKNVDHVVGISQFILDRHLMRGYFENSVQSVVHNSFDSVLNEDRPSGGEIVIGFIGRLVPEKGLDLIIDAMPELLSSSPRPLRLLVAGEGRDDYVRKLTAKADGCSVEFVGRQDPNSFFQRIDFTVVPSVWDEPLGRVVIESIAYGRPVVVTPVGGIPELIEPGFAEICTDVSRGALVESVLRMIGRIEREGSSMRICARLAASKYTSRAIAGRYMGVYAGLQRRTAKI